MQSRQQSFFAGLFDKAKRLIVADVGVDWPLKRADSSRYAVGEWVNQQRSA